MDVDLRYAIVGSIAGRPELRLRDCSRWPDRHGCGQVCLSQVEELPEPAGDADPARPRLAEALDRLPPAQREAFEMLQLEGLSVAAAAARVGITTGALKVRAHRAYKALRALLGG